MDESNEILHVKNVSQNVTEKLERGRTITNEMASFFDPLIQSFTNQCYSSINSGWYWGA